MSTVAGCPFGLVMRDIFLMELFFFDGCLGKVTWFKNGGGGGRNGSVGGLS